MEHYEYEPAQRTWGYILADKAEKNKNKVYLYFKDEKVTYQQLNEYANRVARGYLSLGLRKGDKAAIMMPNCPEFLYHWFGLGKMGGVEVPLNTAYRGDILRHCITNAGAKVLVVGEQFLDRVKFIQDELPTLERVIVHSPHSKAAKADLRFPTHPFEILLSESSADFPQPPVRPSDPFQIIYTSGTTGPSKGVVLSHSAQYWYAVNIIKFLGLNQDTISYHCLPVFHGNHRFTSTYTLLLDTSYAMGERFSVRAFWDETRKYGCNHFLFMGAMLYMLHSQPPKPDDADNTVKACYGVPTPVDITKAFEKRFGLKIYSGVYGMTEASGITRISFDEADRLKAEGKWEQALSMGREQKENYEAKLVDNDDNEVPDGDVGELVCRPTRPYSMMTEYFNNPEATVEAFRNLWFHTGDLARKDQDGYFYFVDRKKDYLRRRGENVSSFEVEKVINSHPAVLESAAVGVKSELGEDEIKIVVELKEGGSLTPEELTAWCEPRMAYFMVPRYIELVDNMPRTPTGRVQKHILREQGVTENTWDREKVGYELKR